MASLLCCVRVPWGKNLTHAREVFRRFAEIVRFATRWRGRSAAHGHETQQSDHLDHSGPSTMPSDSVIQPPTPFASGSGLAASPVNLVSGECSCFSHGAPTHRKLRLGDFGSVEYGAAFKRYTSTIGRQFCIGPPTPRMRELYDVVRLAADAFIAQVRAGVPAVVPHEAAKRVIAEAGLDRGRVHTSGYGLAPGFPPTWGEPMHLFGGSTYTLQAGMVVTVEPPVFLGEEQLGARLIDNVLVTNEGAELLSRFSRDLIVVPLA